MGKEVNIDRRAMCWLGKKLRKRMKVRHYFEEGDVVDVPDDIVLLVTPHTVWDHVECWVLPQWERVANHVIRHPSCLRSDIEKWRRLIMKFVKKAKLVRDELASAGMPQDDQFSSDCPAIWEYLTATKHEDDSTRETTTFLLFFDGGSLKCFINDRDNERTACVSSNTMLDLLLSIEDRLATNTAEWRGVRTSKKGKKRR